MYVILDLHAAPGGQGGNTGISDYNPAYPSLWESNLNKNKTFSYGERLLNITKTNQLLQDTTT